MKMVCSWWARFLKVESVPAPRRRNAIRPHVEALEGREVPATFTVTNLNDGGAGSFRQAILDANGNGNPGQVDLIQFNLPAGLDADFAQTIKLTSPLPAVSQAVVIDGYSQKPSHPNTSPQGAFAGLVMQLDGSGAGANADGLVLNADNSVIRGLVLNRFGGTGVIVRGSNDVVAGNFIGTNPAGTAARGNGVGVLVSGTNGRVGGADLADRNLISGNGRGVVVNGATGTLIQNNFIGTDDSGMIGLGNTQVGVDVVAGNQTLIGGGGTNEGNLISANGVLTFGSGVRISGANTRVQGNQIGLPINLQANQTGLGNGLHGVEVHAGNVLIGGANGQGNTFAFNGGSAVAVEGTVSGVQVLGNTFGTNGTGSIDLGGDGPTANDPLDADAGPNGLQNAPVLTAVTAVPNAVVVSGKLNSRPNTLYRLEIYGAFVPGASGGGGGIFLGFLTVQTDAQGNANFSFTQVAPDGVANGFQFSATATDVSGNTSEFSKGAGVGFVLPPDPVPRGVVATLQRVGKRKVLQVVVRFADTGEVKTVFRSPFQNPAFRKIRVSTVAAKSAGVADTVVLSALRNGKKKVRLIPG
jgi:hypothetical protein